ncbi:MAG: hypothetical protein FWF90_16135, partial [Promicromonosporaceae bacterium]|nr:hypothetical protein [Promicromonosporaceae bacterium]
QATDKLGELEELLAEQMLVTPGDYGARVYAWIDGTTLRMSGNLTHDVPALTLERRPFGEHP